MLKIDEILDKSIIDKNNKNLDDLKERVSQKKVSWVLGSGISKCAGLPLWEECLLKMWARMLMLDKSVNNTEDEFQTALYNLKSQLDGDATFLEKINLLIQGEQYSEALSRINTLESAEYIKNFIEKMIGENLPEKSEEFERIKNATYFNLLKSSLSIENSLGNPLSLEDNESELWGKIEHKVLGVLAQYFSAHAEKSKITVINYNFDDLLEFALMKSGLPKEKCYVKNPGTAEVLDESEGVHIYHPHGTISVAPVSYARESRNIVLAESDYDNLEKKTYIWENSIQAKALHDSSCVFLGFSGEDYNFRRIIKNMEKGEERQENKHYMFISIQSFVKKLFTEEVNRRLLGNIESRTESKREEFLKKETSEHYDDTLREVLNDKKMICEKMLMVRRLYSQYLYWEEHNIIPIWTTRDELIGMIQGIIRE